MPDPGSALMNEQRVRPGSHLGYRPRDAHRGNADVVLCEPGLIWSGTQGTRQRSKTEKFHIWKCVSESLGEVTLARVGKFASKMRNSKRGKSFVKKI